MKKKSLILLIIIIACLSILFFNGSRPEPFNVSPTIEPLPSSSLSLDEYVATAEAHHDFRTDNHAQIIWADSSKSKTDYSLVYLHGFSASHMEGYPVHRALARRYGLNLYLSRLADHGLNSQNPLMNFRADEFVESGKEAIQIAQAIGEHVIVIGTSTGATIAAYLAAHNPELIDALIFFAPNIDVADPRSFLLTYPWGKELAHLLEGEFMSQGMSGPEFDKYWYPQYRTESLVELLSLIDQTMHERTFNSINQPTFISYYFKNENEKDDIISTDAIIHFYESLGTKKGKKVIKTTPASGNHVTISSITSKDIKTPFLQACEFIENKIGLQPTDSSSIEDLLLISLPN